MKGYRFRLTPVLTVRRHEQDTARAALLAAHTAVQQQEQALSARREAYGSMHSASGLSRDAFLARQAQTARAAAAVLREQAALEQAHRVVDQRRQAWTAAATRVSALERLDERARAVHALRLQREDDAAVDDLVVARSAGGRR